MSTPSKTLDLEIAIIGGGFAGVYCAKALRQSLGRRSASRVGIISDENYMVFQPMLPEVAGASISPRHVVNPIRLLCRGTGVYKADVEAIDPGARTLTVRPGPFSNPLTIRFRHLVTALGAVVDLRRVPGMTEHAFLMRNVGDAMKLRATVLSRFEEANLVRDPDRRRRLLTFVVIGGGYSGVETAGQILDLIQGINRYYANVGPDDFRVFLVHSRDHLLPTLSRKLGAYAERVLRRRGLRVILNTRVRALTANNVCLDDDAFIESNTIVSTVGNAPHPLMTRLAEDCGLDTDNGRLRTTETMQVPGHDWLWAAGDCAAVPMSDGRACPATAQFAMRQGILLGKNLAAVLRAREPRPFRFAGLGELAAIGHRTAVAEILGMRFSGFFAWWLWRTIYLAKLPGLDRKLRVVIDWTLDLFFPRDINLLSPRYTRAIQETHLREGDVLFHAGEPAFSFYVVKEGAVRLTDADGATVKTVGGGEFFGERALLSDMRWRFTATAVQPTTLVGLGSAEFKAVLESSSEMRRLLEHSARQYRSAEEIRSIQNTLPDPLLRREAAGLMTRDIASLRDDQSVPETLRQLNRERHSFYPVVSAEDGQPRGVLAREDFYDHIQEHGLRAEDTVAQITCRHLPEVTAGTPVADCLAAMIRGGSNKLLVRGNEGTLAGILSIRDVLAAVSEPDS